MRRYREKSRVLRSLEHGIKDTASRVYFKKERMLLLRMEFVGADVARPTLSRRPGLVLVPYNLTPECWGYPAVRVSVMHCYGQMLLGQHDSDLVPLASPVLLQKETIEISEFFVDYAAFYQLYLAAPLLLEECCDDLAVMLEEYDHFAPGSRMRRMLMQLRHLSAQLNPEAAHLYGGYGEWRRPLLLAREFALSPRISRKLLEEYVSGFAAERKEGR